MAHRNGDMEDTKRAVAMVLASSAFLAILAAIDVEKDTRAANGDLVTTPAPTVVIPGQAASPGAQGYPIAEIMGGRTDYAPGAQQSKDALHEVTVHWTQVGDDATTIDRELERLVRATRDLFWNGSLPEIGNAPTQVVSEEYSDLLPAKDRPFVKGSQTLLRVATFAL